VHVAVRLVRTVASSKEGGTMADASYGGDAVVEGGVHAAATWQTVELRLAIDRVRTEAAGFGLSNVDEALAAASAEADKPSPDKDRVAGFLRTAVLGLREAGALVDEGSALARALRRSASVLGPAAATVLALL
jgi:hypothetical protein